MSVLKSRVPFTPQNPYRTVRPKTSKIIFLSCEGSVTEEEYFALISEIYGGIKSRIQIISVAEDAVFTAPKYRTKEQAKMLSKVRPKHLVERIDQFKIEKDNIYQFEMYPEDEFWIITDVDQNWSDQMIDSQNGKTYKNEWDDAIAGCQEKGYHYGHPYQKTDHFRKRLSDLGAPLKDKKHINLSNYSDEKIKKAVRRAEDLHMDKTDLCPKYFATISALV